jgi:hypothetical protein
MTHTCCRRRRSTQQLLEVYSQASGTLRIFLGVDSSAAKPDRAAPASGQRSRFLAGSIAAQQIRAFVRPTLPGTLWIAEVDLHIRDHRKLLVLRHLRSAIPRQRAAQGCRNFKNLFAQCAGSLWSKNSDLLKRREFLSVLGFVAHSLPQALPHKIYYRHRPQGQDLPYPLGSFKLRIVQRNEVE